uniref:Uncharacterized protein n=1 Tax=Anguilla anguilla TaxID=7936 RepID=A0A0E9XUR1_ANGAN
MFTIHIKCLCALVI